LNEKSSKLRRELDEAMLAEKFDEVLFRKKSAELGELEAERSLIRARAFAKVRPSLTGEQLERMKNMRAEMGRGQMQRGPGPGPGEGGFRPQRPFRPQEERDNDDVLPPPAPPRPPGPPPQ